MLQTHLNGLREVEVFSQLYEQVQKASSCLVEPPVVLHQQRAPVRYDEGGQLHPWTKAEDFFQFQFFAVVVLVNAELSHGFEQPTLSLLINIEQLLITAFNNLPNICSIPSKYGDDIDMGRLSTELGLLTSLVWQLWANMFKYTPCSLRCTGWSSSIWRCSCQIWRRRGAFAISVVSRPSCFPRWLRSVSTIWCS